MNSADSKPVNVEVFLNTLDPNNPEHYRRQWSQFSLNQYLPVITDALLDAAFDAWDLWSEAPTTESDDRLNMPVQGACNVFKRRVEEHLEEGESLSLRIREYIFSPNLDISATTMTFFQIIPSQFPHAEEVIFQAAACDSPYPTPEPGSGRKTLRALAYQVLFSNDSHYLTHPDIRSAGLEFLQSLVEWNEQDPRASKQENITKLKSVLNSQK